jgi:hypothetical protein
VKTIALDNEPWAKSAEDDVLENQQNNHQQHCLVEARARYEISGFMKWLEF